MNKETVSYKEEARRALSRGDLRKALEGFQKHCSQEPEDLRSWRKVGELHERLGQKREAVQVYRKLAKAYAEDGFLLQGISVVKIILRIDPSSKNDHDLLAKLYLERTRETKPYRPLPRIPLLSDLKEEELQSLLQGVRLKTFSKDEAICREGEEGDSLFVITRGGVAVAKEAPRGKEIRVRKLKEGDFFGEFGFFMDSKRHATVRAVADCEILEIGRDDLNTLITTHPRVKEVLNRFFRYRVLDTFLAVSPLFSSLEAEEREEVIKRFSIHKVPENTLLFEQGDPPTSLCMIKSGEVEIFAKTPQGTKVDVAILKSGHSFGEIGAFFNRPRVASARTLRPSELLELTKEDLGAFALRFPGLQSALRRSSFQRFSRLKEICFLGRVEKAMEGMV
jgi:cAMP-dependent protein kinase regulator